MPARVTNRVLSSALQIPLKDDFVVVGEMCFGVFQDRQAVASHNEK